MITHFHSHHHHTVEDRKAGERALRWDALAGFITVAFLAALPAAWIDTQTWYFSLAKPSWSPPAAVFGPAWTLLYTLMGIAAWGVWQKQGWRRPLAVWLMQLGLNTAWTPIFFGLHQPGWAFVEICVLWVTVALMIGMFSRVARWTAVLLLPYLAWITFASALNFEIWRMNS